MQTLVQESQDGGIVVSVSISKLDIMAHDRLDKLLNYTLMQIGDRLAQEIIEKYRDEIYEKLTPDKILAIVSDKIKSSLKIVGDK